MPKMPNMKNMLNLSCLEFYSMLPCQVLTPAAGHDKLKDVAHAAGAALHLLHDGLFESTDRFLTTDNCSSSSSSSSSSSNGSDSNGQSSLQQAFQQNLSDNNNHIGSQSNSKEHDAAGALMIYTSGTTGRPKGALHTHG
jgi:acyl-coenzyme A synthetase/AMP-(fatty) acid ligase